MMPKRIEYQEDRIVPLTLAGQVADRLRNWILLGDLAPGEVMIERELSDRLGVSRTPMREALRLLGSEGLIDIVPNHRPRVADPSLPELLDLLEVHRLLESHATGLAATRIDSKEIDVLDDLLDRMKAADRTEDAFAFFELDMEFHRRIVAASGNLPLIETHAQLNARIYRARYLSTQSAGGRPLMQSQHEAILEALRNADPERARTRLEEHLIQLGRNISRIFKEPSE